MTNAQQLEQLSERLEQTRGISERQSLLKQIWKIEQMLEQLVNED